MNLNVNDDDTVELFRACLQLLQDSNDAMDIEYNDIKELICIQCEHLIGAPNFDQQLHIAFQSAKDILTPEDALIAEWEHFSLVSTLDDDNIECTAPPPPASPNNISRIMAHLDALRQVHQPAQRTDEWYSARRNMLTASNAYKAFGSQALKNSLIYEKCKPLSEIAAAFSGPPNTNTAMHWGVKYEPLSVMWYEYTHNTKIGEFGCITHPKYPFIGASPDGINIDPTSPLFGRMLEIKNVVSRVITGVPKHEYMVQMQLQLEVCDLDECDFLETKFVEFEDSSAFYTHIQNNKIEPASCGCVIQFYDPVDERIIYEFMPLNTPLEPDAIRAWQATIMDINTIGDDNNPGTYHWVETRYWRLDTVSCVLVPRNRRWFQEHIGALTELWDTIMSERESGFAHRAPKSRPKKDPIQPVPCHPSNYECTIPKWAMHALTQPAPELEHQASL